MPLACIFSLSGPTVTTAERALFRAADPLGFILFHKPDQRNCESPDQLRRLTHDLKDILGRDCPILIDQEGGRVQRLKPPTWRQYPPMKTFGDMAQTDMPGAIESLRFTILQIAADLKDGGINVNCAPVLDVLTPETHDVIGDRAFSDDPDIVARLGLVACQTFLEAGITPVVKHMPGHGRACADSHKTLPIVTASQNDMDETDFRPFKTIAQSDIAPRVWGMPTPVKYPALDPNHAACASPAIIENVIRQRMGFQGFLVSDALDMDGFAAYGDAAQRVLAVLNAGCDAGLYCRGQINEMERISETVPPLRAESAGRLML